MSFLNYNPYKYDEVPRPIGPARYLTGLFSHAGGFLCVNLLFLLCCAPIVTAGPALIALHRCCCSVLRGRHEKLLHLFWKSFRENLKLGILYTFTAIPVLAINYALIYKAVSSGIFLSMCIFICLTTAIAAFCAYMFLLTAHTELPLPDLLKNSLILLISGRQYSAASGFLSAAVFFLLHISAPKSLPISFFAGGVLVVYTACFFAWTVADREIFIPYYRAHPEEGLIQGYIFDSDSEQIQQKQQNKAADSADEP